MHFIGLYPVVEVVVDARKMDPAHAPCSDVERGDTYGRLRGKKLERLGQLLANRPGRKRPVLLPPIRCRIDMTARSVGDPDAHAVI